jgi:hypothetical protein
MRAVEQLIELPKSAQPRIVTQDALARVLRQPFRMRRLHRPKRCGGEILGIRGRDKIDPGAR